MEAELDNLSGVQSLLECANSGNGEARSALAECSCQRLLALARRMLHRDFCGLRRWEDTDDILQQAWLRLHRSLGKIKPNTPLEFYRLAATEIRWELIDLCRRYFGPQGIGANQESNYGGDPSAISGQPAYEQQDDTADPVAVLTWVEFHQQVEKLPDDERAVFDLIWYQQLQQEEAASLLGVSVRTVKRRWQRAKLLLYRTFGGQAPG